MTHDRANGNTPCPGLELFQLTAHEAAEMEFDLISEYMKRPEYRLAAVNSRDRDRMFDAMCEEEGITGGWYWWACFPGCLPDGPPMGPFETREEALADARSNSAEARIGAAHRDPNHPLGVLHRVCSEGEPIVGITKDEEE